MLMVATQFNNTPNHTTMATMTTKNPIPSCSTCHRSFNTSSALSNHQKATSHTGFDYSCLVCGSYYTTLKELKHHQECTNHGKDNYSTTCEVCGRHFMTAHGYEQFRHLVDYHPYCQKCCKPFMSERLLENHLNNATPHKTDHHCAKCVKSFPTASALEKHKASLVHNPISNNLTCLGGCGKTFSAPSALVMHLESGGCTGDVGSAIDKKVLDRAVFENDTDGIICHGAIPEAIMTPGSTYDSGAMGLVTLQKNPLCCPLCPWNRPPFVNPRALEQHIQSSVHAPKIYHCPEFLFNGMKIKPPGHMKFRSLSGLVQHLEAGACG
ncbi:hypothetical protein EX30DRAFT_322285, partial [Ascodesmis nigricans]